MGVDVVNKKYVLTNLLLVVGSVVFCSTLLLLGELATRTFTDITLLGLSKNLYMLNAYGTSMGNSKNTEAIAFGVKTFTDEHGFRVPKTEMDISAEVTQKRKTILILGDSVAFGPGLQEEKTLAGMLRRKHRSLRIYNASVNGYATNDYKNVVEHFQPAQGHIDHVFLVFCLNDVSSASAQNIDRFLRGANDVMRQNHSKGQALDGKSQEAAKASDTFVEELRRYQIFRKVNEFLRERSKLYVLAKGILTDIQARWYRADFRFYVDPNLEPGFLHSMQDIAKIQTMLDGQGTKFSVIIAPYEYQLRSYGDQNLLPQRKLSEFFFKTNIDYTDSVPYFKELGVKSKEFFLPYDPMHFSEKGHAVIYSIIAEKIDS